MDEGTIYIDAETAHDAGACTSLLLLFLEVLALWPRPRYDGVLLPDYPDVIVWSNS